MQPFQVSLSLWVANLLGQKSGLTKISRELPQSASKLLDGPDVVALAEKEPPPAVHQVGFLCCMAGLPRKVGHFLMFFLGVCLWLERGPLFSVFVL
jgi:hypothetical protein